MAAGSAGAAAAAAANPAANPAASLAALWGTGAWSGLLDLPAFEAALAAAGAASPPPALLLEALRYCRPQDVAVVIMGQDPYPLGAQGLCFSVQGGAPLPPSLRAIFECLARAGLRASPEERGPAGDLRPWAAQGVLLLNATLTFAGTGAALRRAHAAAWRPFVRALLTRLCAARAADAAAGRPLHFLLWGREARAFGALAHGHGHLVHEWTHPSPLADRRLAGPEQFVACPHFGAVNAALAASGRAAICWDNAAPVTAFSDGACTGNGRRDARASFAAVLQGGQFGEGAVVRGELRPCSYADADGLPAPGRDFVPPSNNRGELMGLIYCFLALLRGRACGPVEVVTDSEISRRTLAEWLPARLERGTERALQNYDLVAIAWDLLCRLRLQAAVVLTHVRSHQRLAPDAPARARVLHDGNDLADRHASAVLHIRPTYAVSVLGSAPPALADLAAEGGAQLDVGP